MPTQCPLCLTYEQNTLVTGADARTYYCCAECSLIFVDSDHFLSITEEKSHYINHQNGIANQGYVHFLNQLLEPMLPYLSNDMHGLDYGCGPSPTLSQLLNQQGISCDNYDPFFTQTSLKPPYDFIVATECFEHFHQPKIEIHNICQLLTPGGLLGIMTECWSDIEYFKTWYYAKDPTHVCFYHAHTLDYVCREYSLIPLWQNNKRIFIFSYLP